MSKLLDVNLALVILHGEHEHSPIAQTWLPEQKEPGSLLLCRVVQMGVLRLLTRRAMMGGRLLSAKEAWSYWNTLLSDGRFRPVEEPLGLEDAWESVAERLRTGACLDTDTYLAAFALAGGYTLATFDKGFIRFAGLQTELLS